MTGARNQRKPTFLWQAALILLPVIVLAIVGWFSLRQDKLLAQHEATDRAQALADDLVRQFWNEFAAAGTNGPGQSCFQVETNGQLVFPPAYETAPVPMPLDLTLLNPEQARLWQIVQSVETAPQDDESLVQTYESFINSDPPDRFAATAHYGLGLLLARQKDLAAAAERFDVVAEEYPDAAGESGLSLRQLALMKLFELEPHEQPAPPQRVRRPFSKPPVRPVRLQSRYRVDPHQLQFELEHYVSLDYVCSNLVNHPTPLTSYLLRELQERWIPAGTLEMRDALRKWQRTWAEHERSRELFLAAGKHFHTKVSVASRPRWVTTEDDSADDNPAATNRLLSVTRVSRPGIVLPRLFWFSTPTGLRTIVPGGATSFEITEQHWLAIPSESDAAGIRYACLTRSEVANRMTALLTSRRLLPVYFSVGIELAGKRLEEFAPDLRLWQYHLYGGKGGHLDKEYMTYLGAQTSEQATNALAFAVKSAAGIEALKVSIYLTSPAALFESQRNRAYWFVLVIATSIFAAVFGLCAAWGGFNRQLRLNEMKSNFVSSVSHELRAPIASVRLLAESLERGKISEPAKQNEYFRFIGQECRRLSSLIENVLDFSRIEQGRKQYEFEPTDIGALVEQTIKLMEPYAAEKGVRLVRESVGASSHVNVPAMASDYPSPGLTATLSPSEGERDGVRGVPEHAVGNSELSIDGRALQQALVNLIDNAIKHSPKDAVVTVRLEGGQCRTGITPVSNLEFSSASELELTGGKKLAAAATATLLSVTDQGPGIPVSEQEKIFARFYRLGSELRRETPGVGIGLSIVQHVVEAHGGRVRVQSEVGKGSRFTIELPGNHRGKF